jgi:hypothetical protein
LESSKSGGSAGAAPWGWGIKKLRVLHRVVEGLMALWPVPFWGTWRAQKVLDPRARDLGSGLPGSARSPISTPETGQGNAWSQQKMAIESPCIDEQVLISKIGQHGGGWPPKKATKMNPGDVKMFPLTCSEISEADSQDLRDPQF